MDLLVYHTLIDLLGSKSNLSVLIFDVLALILNKALDHLSSSPTSIMSNGTFKWLTLTRMVF